MKDIFKEFVEKYEPNELEIISLYSYNLKEISKIGRERTSKLDDSLGFGENFDIISNIVAFIFLIISQKAVELGLELSKEKLLEVLLENKEKIIKLTKERYKGDIEDILSKIISFLERGKNT